MSSNSPQPRFRPRGGGGLRSADAEAAQEILDESNSNAQDPQELVPGFVRCSPNGTTPISEGSLRGSFVAILTRLISKEVGDRRTSPRRWLCDSLRDNQSPELSRPLLVQQPCSHSRSESTSHSLPFERNSNKSSLPCSSFAFARAR